ncbi:MAG TPA: AraC family transcriptional regulator [Chloroflexia bacterium]|nr:AraC family transcriptional regulator [Chloroflexia bacterium]
MELLTQRTVEREEIKTRVNQGELAERIGRAIVEDGVKEVLPGLFFQHSSKLTEPNHGLSDPALCVIAQGSKEVLLGDNLYRYDPAHYLIATVELPITSKIIEATRERPYLSMRLQLDPNLVSSVIVEAGYPAHRNASKVKAIDVSPLDSDLLDAAVRMAKLVESPAQARILQPLITREIIYRLLLGEQGERLRHLAVLGSQYQRILQAIERIRKDFDKPLRIEVMAQDIGMSVSGFHHNFKAVTAMSPVQFQKQLRLQEARRLLLTERLDAASAGYRVGYEDASHFNREYKSLFGNPPMRDAEQLREAVNQIS